MQKNDTKILYMLPYTFSFDQISLVLILMQEKKDIFSLSN